MKDHTQFPRPHRRRLNIVGIDPNGDVWSFGTNDPFRADAILKQMKRGYREVVVLENVENAGTGS